jgi:hypothetical protein
MKRAHTLALATLATLVVAAACGGPERGPMDPSTASSARRRPGPPPPAPHRWQDDEVHLAEVRQLTFGGENAEAYWSWGGDQLVLQSRPASGQGCDRIYRMRPFERTPSLVPVSSGKGTTTCSFFLPGDGDVLYSSTHLGGDECPPRPDHSQGYVWALYDTYDVFRAKADGSGVQRLTDAKGYDAEATVCKKDGSIVFTSTRDGDIDLYRMDADGKNVRRLTSTTGYDGGAFFNADCSKIVWRASRPAPGKEEDEYKALLAKGLVRPSKLEIWVANADGSDPMQLTYLDAASFAPAWHPSGRRIVFSSNYGDPRGREFDLWAVNVDGTGLERITYAPGFDGFPHFSPDGKHLAFSSNRATAKGKNDTNVFVARWSDERSLVIPGPADRVLADAKWLSDPAREGRGVGTEGLEGAGHYIEARFAALGLAAGSTDGGFRQELDVTVGVTVSAGTKLVVGTTEIDRESYRPLGFSADGTAEGPLVLAGWGLSTDEHDDYKDVDVHGKIAVVRRFVPDEPAFAQPDAQRRHGDLRRKAFVAREKGAKALLVVDAPVRPKGAPPTWKAPDESPLPALVHEGAGDSGIPVVVVGRKIGEPLVARLARKERVTGKLTVAMLREDRRVFNVVGRLPAKVVEQDRLPGVVVVGAHYDHLGLGGFGSLAPDEKVGHPGADDNASGTATLLEVTRALRGKELRRDVWIVAFSGEERGVLGSTFFTKNPPGNLSMHDVVAMINMDMVGRLRENRLEILGSDTAKEWPAIVAGACDAVHVSCALGQGGGYGPSDHAPFFAARVPVLHLFSGAHADYHKPSDTADKLNAAGMAQTAELVAKLVTTLTQTPTRLELRDVPSPAPRGDMRSFGASLGTIPDYGGPPKGQKGVLLAGVRPGGPADKGGLKRGDVLVRLGTHVIGSVEDLMYVLMASKPGQTVKAVVVRDGAEVSMDVTFQGAPQGTR